MSFKAKEMTPEEKIRFLQVRLQETINQKRSAIKKLESLRRQKLPKIIYVESDRHQIEYQNEMIRNLLKENELLYASNSSLEKRASEAEQSSAYAEEVSTMYQAELDTLSEQLEVLKKENYTLQQKLNMRDTEISSIKSTIAIPLIVEGEEDDLYSGEQKDLVIDIIKQAFQNSVHGTRRYDVLKSILDANPENGTRNNLKIRLASWFQGFTVAWKNIKESKKNELYDVGFNAVSEKNHIKLVFRGDSRYSITLTCTSSDTARMAKNALSDAVKTVF